MSAQESLRRLINAEARARPLREQRAGLRGDLFAVERRLDKATGEVSEAWEGDGLPMCHGE
jgi:hypothetical protein